ncbi:MAG: hypothetical protein ACJ8HJ_18490 [Massilia sp.]
MAQDSETIDPQASLSEDDDLANSTAPASADAGHQSFDQLDPGPAVEEAGQQATVAMLSGDLGDLGVSGGK